MEKKFSEIIMLVHPLYDLIFGNRYPDVINEKGFNPNAKKINSKEKAPLFQLKKTLGIYGEYLNKQTQKNKLLVLYKPNLDTYLSKKEKEFYHKDIKLYSDLLNRFIAHFENKFPDRFYVSDFNPKNSASKEFLSKDLQKKLKPKVKIKALGEYYTKHQGSSFGCVPAWNRYVTKKLSSIGIKVDSSIIIKSKTLSFFEDGFRDKLLRGHERRKVQEKKKKDKLKINKRKLR